MLKVFKSYPQFPQLEGPLKFSTKIFQLFHNISVENPGIKHILNIRMTRQYSKRTVYVLKLTAMLFCISSYVSAVYVFLEFIYRMLQFTVYFNMI